MTAPRPESPPALADVVAADVRRSLDADTAAWLRSPAMRQEWYEELIALSRKVDSQLARRRTEALIRAAKMHQEAAEAAEWRRKMVGFKGLIEARVAEAKALRRTDAENTEAARLRAAIASHRAAVCGADAEVDTSSADTELWATLKDD